MEEKIKIIEKLGRDLLTKLQIPAETEVKSDGRSILLDIELPDPGILIGRAGQTLSDFQYLLRIMVNRKLGDFTYLTVDVNNYRQRQKDQIEQEVVQAIRLVKTTQRSQILSPMPPANRRVVHILVKEEDELETESVGQDPNRRVLIKVSQEE